MSENIKARSFTQIHIFQHLKMKRIYILYILFQRLWTLGSTISYCYNKLLLKLLFDVSQVMVSERMTSPLQYRLYTQQKSLSWD